MSAVPGFRLGHSGAVRNRSSRILSAACGTAAVSLVSAATKDLSGLDNAGAFAARGGRVALGNRGQVVTPILPFTSRTVSESTSYRLRHQIRDGCPMDKRRAEGMIRFALIFNVVALLISVGVTLWSQMGTLYPVSMADWNMHLFLPWLFPGRLGLPLLVALLALIMVMALWRSRVAAVLLLVVYELNRILSLILLYGSSGTYRAIWKVVALIWLVGFAPGIVGTFAYHRPNSGKKLTLVALLVIIGAGALLVTAA